MDGTVYEGEWKYNKMNGKGVLKKRDETYEGQFLDNMYHGKVRLFNLTVFRENLQILMEQ